MSETSRPRDPGLQVERTALAWRRTALAAVALGLLLTRLGLEHDRSAEVAAGAVTLATAVVLARQRSSVRTVAVALTGVCGSALAVVLTHA